MPRSLTRRLRLIVLGCLALFVALTGGSMAARKHSTDPAALRSKLATLRAQQSYTKRKLRIARQKETQVSRRLHQIQQNLVVNEQRLHGLKKDVSSARTQLTVALTNLQEATDDVETRQDQAAERVLALCQEGELKPLDVALQSTSFSDFANRMYLVNRVVATDANMLDELSDAQDRADSRRQEVAQKAHQLDMARRREEGVREITLDQRATTQEQKSEIVQSRAQLERDLWELEADSRSITAMLAQRQSRNRAIGFAVTPWKGRFINPVNGRVTSPFGLRMHPILHVRKMHTGVDLRAGSGTPIRAAAGGVVAYSARYGGYGNCIMVDHGGGVVTLYGHCSRLAASVGQKVDQGQTIAYVGSTGLSSGPHLHFEVRRNGAPSNPMGVL